MKQVIRAIVLLIILYFLEDYFRYSDYYNIIRIAFLAAFIYLIVAIIGYVRMLITARKKTDLPVQNAVKKSSGGLWLFLIIVLVVLIFFLKEILGIFSFKIFVFLDNLVKFTGSFSPVIFWGVLGLLAGAVYGSVTAWKKYKLNFTVNFIPAGVFVLGIIVFFLVNKPLNSITATTAQSSQTEYAYNLVTAENFNPAKEKNALYQPPFLLDNNDKTAWVTDVARSGTKEEITFTFKNIDAHANKHLQCIGFAIKNGYRKSPQLWSNFARVKEISILHNGDFLTLATAGDMNNNNEEIKITPTPISSFDYIGIRINTVYPGGKYKTRAAITELVPIMQYDNF